MDALKQSAAANKSGKAVPAEIQAILRQETHISHNVTNFEFFYEPFYVASDMVPPHDERFLGYGFTRNTQVRLIMWDLVLFLSEYSPPIKL